MKICSNRYCFFDNIMLQYVCDESDAANKIRGCVGKETVILAGVPEVWISPLYQKIQGHGTDKFSGLL